MASLVGFQLPPVGVSGFSSDEPVDLYAFTFLNITPDTENTSDQDTIRPLEPSTLATQHHQLPSPVIESTHPSAGANGLVNVGLSGFSSESLKKND